MGRDNQARNRQAAKLARKNGKRHPADRLLIVCEGSKTEPQYLNELRIELRLPTANISVLNSGYGTSPDQIVEYAKDLFLDGNPQKKIKPKSFEKVFVVFDRDDHKYYHDGLHLVSKYDKSFKNDQKMNVPFEAFVSVPCFELWLLLHYQDCHSHFLHRDEVKKQLKIHIPDYEKGQTGYYQKTKDRLVTASIRADIISAKTTAKAGDKLYTDIHKLINILKNLKK